MDEIRQMFDAIEHDTVSGSAALADNLIAALLKHKHLTVNEKHIILDSVDQLISRRPFFVVFKHLAEALKKSNEPWPLLLTSYRERFNQIHLKIHEQLLALIGSGAHTFLLHSNSKTVTSVFETITKHHVAKIYQTKSQPENEGVIQAQKLQDLGFDVSLVDDDAIEVDRVDFFVTGADLILPSYIVNKAGTLRIAEEIHQLQKPYVVFADERKFSTAYPYVLPTFLEFIPRNLVSKLITGEVVSS